VPSRRIVVAVVALVTLAGAACAGTTDTTEARQAAVARRGARVMPFDLEATTHTFTKTHRGGIQLVTADDRGDAEQIRLIREHLRRERDKFARGDFEDPARIHGMNMPGVAELSAGYADIELEYRHEPAGARLVYTTRDPALVDAIHAWFDRQVRDHGAHATAG
jgi:hypothetical protein